MRTRASRWLPLSLVCAIACTPDIPQGPAPGAAVVAAFDPGAAVPVVPTPNDLAIDATTKKIVVPPSPTDSPAQREFNRDYLGLLDGFPFESVAQATTIGALDPVTVNAANVLAFDTQTGESVAIAPAYANGAITIAPPAGGWKRAKRYAIALVGGAKGLRGVGNLDVIGSPTWTLVSSPNPLVSCQDLKTNCLPLVDVIPPDQVAKAIQLEQLRRGYAPLLDALAAKGIPRANVPLLWTFTIVDAGEVTFDPANHVLPFPNDAVRTGPVSTTGQATVSLPNPTTGQALTAADCGGSDPNVLLTCALDTLDGFSTLAPLVSESSLTLGALAQGSIDGASLTAAKVGLARLAGPSDLVTAPKWTPCLNCASSAGADGKPQTTPQQLQWRLDAPLDERTTYAAYVTTDVKDDHGKNVIPSPAFALLRATEPLVDANGRSTVNVLSDAQAAAFEPLRLAAKPAFDALAAGGAARTTLALAFAFTTQSEGTVLQALAALPAAAAIPDTPLAVADATTRYNAIFDAAGAPRTAIGKVYEGAFFSPVAVTGPSGTLDVAHPSLQPVAFVVMLPKNATAGVTIFGHDFTRSRVDVIGIANAIAATGQAVIATDVLDHGERSSCTGSKAATGQPSDDAACAVPATMRCDEQLVGLCVLRDDTARAACAKATGGDATCAREGQGRCSTDGKCQGAAADFLRDATGLPVISGWNIFSLTNFLATRDNLRQQVIDLAQLVRVLKSTATANLRASTSLDASVIHYVGQGLGGILGTLFNAVSPDTTNVVLDAPGGALPSLILDAPAFAKQKAALLGALTAEGVLPGTPTFDQFLGSVQWILDAADPANVAYRLSHSLNPGRKAFIQFIEGDETVPNVSTFALLAGANRSFVPTPPSFGCTPPLACYELTEAGDQFDAVSATPATRHGFLLRPPSGTRGLVLTAKAQTQAATFLATGSLQ